VRLALIKIKGQAVRGAVPIVLEKGPGRAQRSLLLPPQQVRQLGEVHRHPPRFIFGEQLGR
jgi:hypothetical protein